MVPLQGPFFIINIGSAGTSASRQCAKMLQWCKPSAQEGQRTAHEARTYSQESRILPTGYKVTVHLLCTVRLYGFSVESRIAIGRIRDGMRATDTRYTTQNRRFIINCDSLLGLLSSHDSRVTREKRERRVETRQITLHSLHAFRRSLRTEVRCLCLVCHLTRISLLSATVPSQPQRTRKSE